MQERFYYSIASGSSGNCGLYCAHGTKVLIDLGVSVRSLRQALAKLKLDIPDLDAVLITHEHIDHVKGLTTFVKKYDIPLYATRATTEALVRKQPLSEDNLRPFDAGMCLTVGQLAVRTFLTPHDAADSVGYVLEGQGSRFGFATDLGFMPGAVLEQLIGCDTVVLESNHDPYLLQTGAYPWPLKQRVSGPRGHLSNPDCAVSATELVKNGTRTLILAHLSENNNSPLLAFRETRQALDDAGVQCELYVAPREAMEQPLALHTEAQACCL